MDRTEKRKDASKTNLGETPGGTKGTSQDKGKPYTDAQIEKIKSDAAAEAGRLRKAAEVERDTLKEDLQSTVSRLDNLERETNQARVAEARGDPIELRKYQREQTVATREREADKRERDLTRREEQLKAGAETLAKDKGVVTVAYIAAKYGLETEELESLSISDEETLEKVAAKLATAKPKTPEGEVEAEDGEEFHVDSGQTTGGGARPLTTESVGEMSIAAVDKALSKEPE